MAFDEKCWNLAAVFLSDEPHLSTTDRCNELAQLIQTTIEDFIASEQSNYESPQHGDAWDGGFVENH